MARIDALRELIAGLSEPIRGALLLDSPEFDRSVIGVEEGTGRVVYDYDAMAAEMAEEAGISEEEAMEFNTMRALEYADPERRPIVVRRVGPRDYTSAGGGSDD